MTPATDDNDEEDEEDLFGGGDDDDDDDDDDDEADGNGEGDDDNQDRSGSIDGGEYDATLAAVTGNGSVEPTSGSVNGVVSEPPDKASAGKVELEDEKDGADNKKEVTDGADQIVTLPSASIPRKRPAASTTAATVAGSLPKSSKTSKNDTPSSKNSGKKANGGGGGASAAAATTDGGTDLASSIPSKDRSGKFGLPKQVTVPASVTREVLQGRLLDTIRTLPPQLINDALQEFDDAVHNKGQSIRNHGAYLFGVVKRYISVQDRTQKAKDEGRTGSGELPMGSDLTPAVNLRLAMLVSQGYCTDEEMNHKVKAKIKMLSETQALNSIEELASVSRSQIRNFGSYFMGILNRYMRGEPSKINTNSNNNSNNNKTGTGGSSGAGGRRKDDRQGQHGHDSYRNSGSASRGRSKNDQADSYRRERSRDRYGNDNRRDSNDYGREAGHYGPAQSSGPTSNPYGPASGSAANYQAFPGRPVGVPPPPPPPPPSQPAGMQYGSGPAIGQQQPPFQHGNMYGPGQPSQQQSYSMVAPPPGQQATFATQQQQQQQDPSSSYYGQQAQPVQQQQFSQFASQTAPQQQNLQPPYGNAPGVGYGQQTQQLDVGTNPGYSQPSPSLQGSRWQNPQVGAPVVNLPPQGGQPPHNIVDILGLAEKAASVLQQQQQRQQNFQGQPIQQQANPASMAPNSLLIPQVPQSYAAYPAPAPNQRQLMGQSGYPPQAPAQAPYQHQQQGVFPNQQQQAFPPVQSAPQQYPPQNSILPPQQYQQTPKQSGGGGGAVRNQRTHFAKLTDLAPSVQYAVQNLQANRCVDAPLDEGILGMILDLPENVAVESINRFALLDKSKVRNKTSYLAGLLRKELTQLGRR